MVICPHISRTAQAANSAQPARSVQSLHFNRDQPFLASSSIARSLSTAAATYGLEVGDEIGGFLPKDNASSGVNFSTLIKTTTSMFISAKCERSTVAIPDRPDLSIARSQPELEEAFRLVYKSYIRSGLTAANATEMRLTPYHFLSTTEVMLGKVSGTSVTTASLIVDGELGLPAESIYAREIATLRRKGLRMAEVGCLADRRESPLRFIQMFRQLSTLIAQAAAFRGCNALIAATHPKHARFYIRQLGFQQIGELQACPYAQGNPAVALLMDFEQLKGSDIHTHLFGTKFSDDELRPFDWDASTRAYFTSVYQGTRPESQLRQQASAIGLPVSILSTPALMDLPVQI